MIAATAALDNPFWSSLTTRHARFAEGGALARRYPSTISPLVGMPGCDAANVDALEALVDVGDEVAMAGPCVPTLPSNWQTLKRSTLIQMVRSDRTPLPEGDAHVTLLGEQDVDEMLALVEAARPGPFQARTIELGTYLGIRESGRLVAMAGERLWIGNFREVSAVCTHPDARGRGYARALVARVVNLMLMTSETPFLHVRSSNVEAFALYESLGFVRRVEYPILYARRES